MADLFGHQVGCKFEEGVVDSETQRNFGYGWPRLNLSGKNEWAVKERRYIRG